MANISPYYYKIKKGKLTEPCPVLKNNVHIGSMLCSQCEFNTAVNDLSGYVKCEILNKITSATNTKTPNS